jgi:hypothetical protein
MNSKRSKMQTGLLCFAMVLGLGACTGATGPMGNSAPNTVPICYYCNNFDSDSVASGWSVQQGNSNGPIDVYLDDNLFNSPGQSLAISCTSAVGNDAQVYRTITIKQNKDLWIEYDFNLTGSYSAGQEFFVNLGGAQNNAVLGWDGSGMYLVQGSTRIYLYINPDLAIWHHAKIQINPNTGVSNYWMDGLMLGSGYTTSYPVVGSPAPTGYIIGVKPTSGLGSYFHIDNLQCYHL